MSECKNQFDAYQKLSKSGVFSNRFPVKLIELIENVDAVVNMQPTSFQNIKLWEYICPNKFLLAYLNETTYGKEPR